MALYKGSEPVAGLAKNTIVTGFNIFDCKWSDHIINDIQWLRADTFSWHSGDVYTTAYNKLVEEWNNGENAGTIIPYRRTPNNFRIADASQEQAILDRYNSQELNGGVTWFYILDTENKRFKLPRTKWGFKGLRTNVGENINESLPNITGNVTSAGNYGFDAFTTGAGAFQTTTSNGWRVASTTQENTNKYTGLTFDASHSSSTYQDNAPVQERATQMYLYFYVGEYAREAIEQTAGINSEMFNNKQDVISDLSTIRNNASNAVNTNASNLSTQGRSLISGLGMPSGKYINLTLGANGSTYIAPANGYYYAGINGMTNAQYFRFGVLDNNNVFLYSTRQTRPYATSYQDIIVPIQKGYILKVEYTTTGSVTFKFIYAEGEQ